LTCVGGYSFSHSMNTHELFVRFDGLLAPFHVGWHEFVDMFLELLCWSTICSCDVSFGSSYAGPLRASRHFVLIITLALFFELISHDMLFRGTQ
jgi:hypothetical protein